VVVAVEVEGPGTALLGAARCFEPQDWSHLECGCAAAGAPGAHGGGADHAQRSGRRMSGAVLAGGARRRPVVDEASRRVRGGSA
jgi:hypothetical protein